MLYSVKIHETEVRKMARLSDPVTMLKGVGPAKAKRLENLNIFTLRI